MAQEPHKIAEPDGPFLPAEDGPEETAQGYDEKVPDAGANMESVPSGGSVDRDSLRTGFAKEKKLALIKAWEESEKSKAENRSDKQLSSVVMWENSKKASIEAQLRKFEEKLERKKAGYAERMKNRTAEIHKEAEQKRAAIAAKRGEDLLRVEEQAATYRASGIVPKKSLGCFGGG